MIYINKGGKIVYVNQRCVELMGFKKEEFYAPGFSFLSLIAPEHIPLVMENLAKHQAGMEIPAYEYVLYTKDRKRLVGLHTTRLTIYEGETAILGIVTDVTEHRHVEEELRKLHRAVEQSPTSIVITDIEGTIEYVNPKFSQITEYTLEEAKGLSSVWWRHIRDSSMSTPNWDAERHFGSISRPGKITSLQARIEWLKVRMCAVARRPSLSSKMKS